MVVKFVGFLQPSGLSLCAVKTRRHLKYHCTGKKKEAEKGILGSGAQIVMRLMRQVYFCINISSHDSHWCCSSLTGNQQTTLHSLSVKWRLHLGAKIQPSSPRTYFYITKQTSRFVQTAAERKKRIKSHSLKHFLPFLLPPTVITESGGLVTRVMWKTLDQYPLTFPCMCSEQHWNIHALHRFISCIHLFLFLDWKEEYSTTTAQFKYRYTGCEL